jgi:glucose/arabinose dehydrogenase
MPFRPFPLALAALLLAAQGAQAQSFRVTGTDGTEIVATPTASFDAGWAIAALPDGRMLVTEKDGALVLVSNQGRRLGEISGTPPARDSGQGGLGDVVLHPDFERNGLIYLSPVEWEGGRSGAVVYRARLELGQDGGRLTDLERIWAQQPKVDGTRHYSQRMAFGPDGYLYVTSGDRGLQDPAQDPSNTIGTIVRLEDDGTPAPNNPFAGGGPSTPEIWTYGHRNPLGLAFASDGTLWSHEMGPRGGDELNVIRRGQNYGWPAVSDGRNYSGIGIPDHGEGDGFAVPATSWVPSISPSGLVIYEGGAFPDWRGDALMGGLSSQALIRVDLQGESAQEAARYSWGERVREVEQTPDGTLWVLEDGAEGRLLRLSPAG